MPVTCNLYVDGEWQLNVDVDAMRKGIKRVVNNL